MEYVITFHTHFDALQYDRFLKRNGIKGRLQPVPRSLSSSCGTCVRFTCETLIPQCTEMEFEKLFSSENGEYNLVAESKI